jgi:hypothetical protein
VVHRPAAVPAAPGGVAVADFNQAVPLRLGGSGTSTAAWPVPAQAAAIPQHRVASSGALNSSTVIQQQQYQQGRPGTAPLPQQQHQQQRKASWACSVCTYEHTGSEAEFLFCAMCSSQRPA